MIKLAIIGAGQLGSRHLQALSKLRFDCEIYIVDPSPESIALAQSRFNETYNKNFLIKLYTTNKLTELPKDISFAIIATNADCRRDVLEYLLLNTDIRYYIIEKVLFQKVEDYYTIKDLSLKKDVKAWVNCPRRMWKFYKNLKREKINEQLLQVSMTGSNWGFASNSIHFLDLISFFTGTVNYQIDSLSLENKIIETKRKGFYDFFGNLSGRFENGTRFSITSLDGDQIPFMVCLHFANSVYFIRDWEGVYYKSEFKDEFQKNSFEVEYQSSLTNIVVNEILETGSCSLTPIIESIDLHLLFISKLCREYKLLNSGSDGLCPIT